MGSGDRKFPLKKMGIPKQLGGVIDISLGNGLVIKLQWNTTIFTQGKQFENVVCKMMSILSWPKCVNAMYPEKTDR